MVGAERSDQLVVRGGRQLGVGEQEMQGAGRGGDDAAARPVRAEQVQAGREMVRQARVEIGPVGGGGDQVHAPRRASAGDLHEQVVPLGTVGPELGPVVDQDDRVAVRGVEVGVEVTRLADAVDQGNPLIVGGGDGPRQQDPHRRGRMGQGQGCYGRTQEGCSAAAGTTDNRDVAGDREPDDVAAVLARLVEHRDRDLQGAVQGLVSEAGAVIRIGHDRAGEVVESGGLAERREPDAVRGRRNGERGGRPVPAGERDRWPVRAGVEQTGAPGSGGGDAEREVSGEIVQAGLGDLGRGEEQVDAAGAAQPADAADQGEQVRVTVEQGGEVVADQEQGGHRRAGHRTAEVVAVAGAAGGCQQAFAAGELALHDLDHPGEEVEAVGGQGEFRVRESPHGRRSLRGGWCGGVEQQKRGIVGGVGGSQIQQDCSD